MKSAGEGEIFRGYRTYVTMTTIESEPIPTIWPDLGEKLALKRTMRIRITANNPYLHNFISMRDFTLPAVIGRLNCANMDYWP